MVLRDENETALVSLNLKKEVRKKNLKYAFKSFFKCFKKIFSKKVFFGELLFKGFRRRFEMHSSY